MKAGDELGPSSWLDVGQARIDAFAAATEDHQSIHIDPEAAAAGPYGTTVAHGFLTLSLVIRLWNDVAPPRDGVSINYGLNRVRFPAPVPSGSRIRGRFHVAAVDPVPGGRHATIEATVEREGGDRPVCVAELVLRLVDA
ncbi:MAG TPA: MaoC family dehydratase [Gaiellaceae bacterium]|nr:MaoC family dehydratase [Gaiellaceae bacterium]